MSGQDVLARASRALCEQAIVPSLEASRTRALVMLRASRRERRSRRIVLLSPIAAVLGVSTAWASTHGGGFVWTRLEGLLGTIQAKAEPPAHGRAGRVPAATSPADTAGHEPALSARVPELQVEELPLVAAISSTRVEEPAPSSRHDSAMAVQGSVPVPKEEAPSASGTRVPIEDEAARLYAAAHHAHFVERDPGKALQAWDAFLAVAPEGSLAPEARYNRALALVRLDRRAAARRALEPFAEGLYGSYRIREARALIEALGP
jgi:hypothetical protein